MNRLINGLSAALLGGLWICGAAASASASSVSINDSIQSTPTDAYIGGNPGNGDPNNSYYDGRDVIGNYDVFAIHSMDVKRTGTTGNDVEVTVFTNFAGQAGTSAASNMKYGALFIGTDDGTIFDGTNNTTTDTYDADKQRFQYALDMNYNPGSGDKSGDSTLWALAQGANLGDDVQQTVAGGTYRNKQAWRPYTSDDPLDNDNPENGNPAPTGKQNAVATNLSGTWEVSQGTNDPNLNTNAAKSAVLNDPDEIQTGLTDGTGYIQFVITDFFGNGNPGDTTDPFLVFAYAMQCGNDTIVALAPVSQLTNPVPLPGGVVLLLSGLLGLGWLGRYRARQA